MKNRISEYLLTDRKFDSGVHLYMQYGNSLSFKNTLNRQGFSKYNHDILLEELRKLAGVSPEQFKIFKQSAPEENVNVKQDVLPQIVTPAEKEVLIREIPEQIRKSIRLRDDFPFLASADCPDEFKILVHDMLSAYSNYIDAHKRLFDATTGDELQEIASAVVEGYLENRQIWDELNHYKLTGKILGKHVIFSTTDRMLEIRNMTTAELVKLQKSLMNNIARYKKTVKDHPEHKNTQSRKQNIAKWEVELVTVNSLLGI
ncbi:MAG: hypothetical protein ACOYN4_05250 [Bacteroidales bacterium]